MSIQLIGNLIIFGAIALAAIVVAIIFVLLMRQPVPESYTYCYDCKYGLCTETPKSKDCFKYQEELEEKKCKQVGKKQFFFWRQKVKNE